MITSCGHVPINLPPCNDYHYQKELAHFIEKSNIKDFIGKIEKKFNSTGCAFYFSWMRERRESLFDSPIIDFDILVNFDFKMQVLTHTENRGGALCLMDDVIGYYSHERHFDSSVDRSKFNWVGNTLVFMGPCVFKDVYQELEVEMVFENGLLKSCLGKSYPNPPIDLTYMVDGLSEMNLDIDVDSLI